MSLRGLLRGFGLKVGPTTPSRFAGRIRDLVEGNATLEVIAAALLVVHETLRREFAGFEKRVRSIARSDGRVRLLMSTPGVGAIVALTYVAAIDDPARFKSSKGVGAHFGLTPKKYQSGAHRIGDEYNRVGAPAVRPHMPEGGHHAVGDDRLEVVRHARQRIESDRPLKVGGVEVDEVVRARAGDMREGRFGEVIMRIEESQTFAGDEVLPDQIEQEGAFCRCRSGRRCKDDGGVLADRARSIRPTGGHQCRAAGLAQS